MDELNTLAKLFEGGHYSLYGQGQQAVDQAMQRKQADLQSVLGAEQRAQAMQPLELENKRATTRLNTSTAALNENSLQDRMKKSFYELDDMQREKVNQDMNRRFQIASAVKSFLKYTVLYRTFKILFITSSAVKPKCFNISVRLPAFV